MTEENPESYEEAVHYGGGSDYSEEMARDEFLAEQAKADYEAMQKSNAMAAQEAGEQEQQAEKEGHALFDLKRAITNLEGIKIPYNIIKNYIVPLKEWLDGDQIKPSGDSKRSIIICIPCYKFVPSTSFICFMNVIHQLHKYYDVSVLFEDSTYITLARSNLANKSLNIMSQKKIDLILWMDCDHIFDLSDVINLIESSDKYNFDMLSALYYLRNQHKGEMALAAMYKFDTLGGFENIESWERNSVIEVDGAGFGMLIMKPDVLLKMSAKLGKFIFQDGIRKSDLFGDIFVGEDLNFFRTAKELDLKVGIATGIKIGHYGGIL